MLNPYYEVNLNDYPILSDQALRAHCCVLLTGQRCSFQHRRRGGRLSPILPRSGDLPGACAHFVPLLGVFRLADRACAPPPESPAPCWHTVATVYPLGNCDSLRPETSLSYLSRRPSGLRKTKHSTNSLAHRTTCLRSDFAVGRLSFGRTRLRATARVTGTVLAHSSNRLPSG